MGLPTRRHICLDMSVPARLFYSCVPATCHYCTEGTKFSVPAKFFSISFSFHYAQSASPNDSNLRHPRNLQVPEPVLGRALQQPRPRPHRQSSPGGPRHLPRHRHLTQHLQSRHPNMTIWFRPSFWKPW